MQLKTLAPVELTVIGFTGFVLNIFLVTTRCLKNEELWGLIRRKKMMEFFAMNLCSRVRL